MNETQKPNRSRWLKVAIPVVISAALVAWIIHSMEDPAQVWEEMQKAALLPLLGMIPVSLSSHLLRAWRWRRFIGQPVSTFYAFTSVMIGYAVNDVLPRVGEVVRVVNMNRMTKVPIARLLSTLLAERLLDVIALVTFLGISILIEGDRISAQFPALASAGPLALLAAGGGLGALFLVAYSSNWLCRITGRLAGKIHAGFGAKLEELIRQGAEGLAFLKRPSQVIPALVETAGIWMLYWVAFQLGLHAFGVLDSFASGTVSFSITCAGVLVPTVGAIGSYHEFGMRSLSDLYAVDQALALACITVIHFILFYIVGGLCGVLAWGLQVVVRRRQNTE